MGNSKYNRLLSLLPNSFTYGSDTSGWELGNGERGQNTLRGRVKFSEVGDVIPPERIGKNLLGVPLLNASPTFTVEFSFRS